MKGLLLYLMLIWTVFCPLMTVFSNPIIPSNHAAKFSSVHLEKLSNEYSAKSNDDFQWEQSWMVEDTGDVDILSWTEFFTLTPQYFFVFVYAGLLIQFFFFFKRRLPFCYYLAGELQSSYLTQRVIRI